ncbi:MAG: RDD family protein [Sediminibacterium sp.]|nr:RDD family protein [Sediminibacterium sp.]MBX9779097.1 RDD family protein [Chitinophagaceae bacterium]
MQTVGDGTRILNFLIDTLLVFLLAMIAFRTWNWYVYYWRFTPYNFGWFFFGSVFIYYTLFETLTQRTPGKWLSKSKVVNISGKKPSLLAVMIRSLARITVIDLFFSPFLGMPLHDYISKTRVVSV